MLGSTKPAFLVEARHQLKAVLLPLDLSQDVVVIVLADGRAKHRLVEPHLRQPAAIQLLQKRIFVGLLHEFELQR